MDLEGRVAQGGKTAYKRAWLHHGGGLTKGAQSSDCVQRNQLSYFLLLPCAQACAEL